MSTEKNWAKLLVGNPVEIGTSKERYDGFLLPDEVIKMEYKGIRNAALFTNKRLLVVDPQGLRGRKVELITIPWSQVTCFSVENAGTFDLDAELKLWGSGFNIIELSFTKGTDVRAIGQYINTMIL